MNIIEKTQLFSSEKFQEAVKYWKNIYNEDYSSVSIFPNLVNDIDRNVKSYDFNLTFDQYTAVSKLCKNEISLFTYLFTAYSILVYKITGREKVLFSSPQLKNTKKSYNKLLGIPVNFELSRTFKDLLIKNKESIANSYKYNIYPLKEIPEIADIILESDLVKNLIYFSGLHCDKQIDDIEEMDNHGISCRLVKKSESIRCELRFNINKCDEFVIQQLGESFSNILSQTLGNIDINIKDINLIENNTSELIIDKSSDADIVSVFEEQVKLYSNKTSVICPTDMSNIFNTYDITENAGTSGLSSFIYNRYTYSDLNIKANQLAHILIKKGIKENDIVALALTPSFEMMVSILAVLKAGGAYLPIDTDFPVNRVDFMLTDSKSKVLITHDYLMDQFTFDRDLIDIDNIDLSEEPDTNLGKKISKDQLVYMIYTSGTSGQPKGVMLKHENIANYTNWFRDTYKIDQTDKSALLSSYAFDLGYTALFTSILSGAEIHLIPKDIYTSMSLLINYIKSEELTYLKLTPSLFSVMIESDEFNSSYLSGLKNVILGGEKISIKDVEKAYKLCENLLITNHYGPTEATIGCIAKQIKRSEIEELNNTIYNNSIIGLPIRNTQVYILNHENQILPDGLPGEICISGKGLAKGYLNQEELTNERFIALNNNPSVRIYKTGDLGRKSADGNIEFIGRIDTQLKINGYRIELQEVEKSLNKLKFIDQAVVIPKKDNDQNTVLYAYYKNKLKLSANDLKDQKKLSDHIIDIKSVNNQEFDYTNIERLINNKSIKYNGELISKDEVDQITSKLANEILGKYNDTYSLTLREKIRYKRQMLLQDWGIQGQEKLKSTKVFVAGAGGGASPTVMQLALAGFGTIVICDFDAVELSNLNRQVLHNESRIGMNKALSAQLTIKEINPNINVIPVTEKLTKENVYEMIGDCDMIFDMFDGQQDKFILSECAVAKGIPHFISAMTDINSYAGIFHSPHTPCFSCLFDREKLDTLISGMKDTVEDYEKDPLAVVATSLFQSSSIAVNEAIKYVLYPNQVAYNKYFYINQKGSSEIINSPSYQSMIFAYSDHFLNECKQQGFDWENEGWRGKFLEELEISKNKECKICYPPTDSIEFTINIEDKNTSYKQTSLKEQIKKSGSIAILTDNIKDTALCLISSLKLNIPLILLDKNNDIKALYNDLDNSNCRVVLTNSENLSFSEDLVNTFNKNIAIINIDNISSKESEENIYFKWNPSITAYYKNVRKEISDIDECKEELNDLVYFLQNWSNQNIKQPDTYLDTIGIVKNEKLLLTLYSKLFEEGDVFDISRIETSIENIEDRIKDELLKELPIYMIPAHLIELESIPLTPNGKVDLKALAELELKVDKVIEMPRNRIEEVLCKIWSEVLGIKQVGINQNFFEIGGHSLKATLLISKIHKEIGVVFPLGEIFKYSTIESQASRIAKSARKEFLSIPKAKEQPNYPLSSAQKRLYLLQQLDLNSIAYNIPNIISLGKEADKEKIQTIFKHLIKRHESFRTSIILVDNELFQVVSEDVTFELQELSIEKTEVKQVRNKFIKSFDLSKAPYLRVAFVDIKGGDNLLLIDMHHIISDATSHMILEREFQSLYSGEELAPLELQYKDYSQWQNSKDYQEIIKDQEQYWLNKFEGEIPVLNLPTDYVRPLVQSHEGARVSFVLSKEETKAIKLFTEENDLTLYMSLLSVYSILLSKLSGQDDIVVGTPIAGRNHADLQNIVGMFVNTLSIRNEIRGEDTIYDFVSSLKQTVLGAYENQNYQFEDLVDKVSVERNTSRNPIFDVMFNLLNQIENKELVIEDIDKSHEKGTSKFELNLTAIELESNIILTFEYSTRLFKEETIDRFINYFKQIAVQLTRNTELKISSIDILTEEEKQQILHEFNNTKANYPKDKTVHQIFEEQVEKTPENVALSLDGKTMKYSELNVRANQLAWNLREQGVKNDSIVGLCVERSVEMVVGILGILKAGGAYLPIDKEYPKERISYMFEDSKLQTLLVNTDIDNLNIETEQYSIYDLRNESSYTSNSSNLGVLKKPEDLIYIIYTSGSTGKPKGVMLEDRNIVNLIHFNHKKTNIDFSCILQFSTISFDVSANEIFGTLLCGGKLVLVDELTRLNVMSLFELMKREQVKTVFWPMSFIKMIFGDQIFVAQLPKCLRHIQTAGEQLVISESLKNYLKTNNVFIHNHYGPSETHVVTTLTISPEDNHPEFPTIGRPISNTSAYILDKSLKPVPIGAIGELYFGGIQVGRGYFGNEEITKEKFIKSPVIKGETIYQTGDLAKWTNDGDIEFLGRVDFQVKIRGFRIELEEIESALLKHENIKESVVIAIEENNDKYLCGYVVCKEELNHEKLRAYMSSQLPDYMVPSYFVELEKLPLTSNGKVNRKALPVPEIKAGDDYVAPSNEIEEKLVEIWSGVLNIDKKEISVSANFFSIGGHSLKATALASNIHKGIGVEFPLGDVFLYPTIKDQAYHIETKEWLSNNQDNIVKSGKTEISI